MKNLGNKTFWNTIPREKKVKPKKPRLFFIKLLKQYRSGEKMFIYEETKLKKYLVEKIDMMVSQIVRSRDCAGGRVKCGSVGSCTGCTTWITYGTSVAAHRIDRGWWSHRWDFRNVWATCRNCNDPAYDAIIHKTELQFKIEGLYGRDTVREMRTTKDKTKPRLDEMVELYDKILPVWQQIPIEWKA